MALLVNYIEVTPLNQCSDTLLPSCYTHSALATPLDPYHCMTVDDLAYFCIGRVKTQTSPKRDSFSLTVAITSSLCNQRLVIITLLYIALAHPETLAMPTTP